MLTSLKENKENGLSGGEKITQTDGAGTLIVPAFSLSAYRSPEALVALTMRFPFLVSKPYPLGVTVPHTVFQTTGWRNRFTTIPVIAD